MTKVVSTGATRVSSPSGRLIQFPKRHLILAAGVSVTVLMLIGLVPAPDVEANKTRIPVQIDAHKPESVRNQLLAITQPEQAIISITPAPRARPKQQNTKAQQEAQQEARQKAGQQAQEQAAPGRWQQVTVQSGDNLSNLFSQQGLSARVVYDISRTPRFGELLTNIRPGQTLEFRINNNNELTRLRYVRSKLSSIVFHKNEQTYQAEEVILKPEIRTAYAEGVISNSLFLASQKAGLTEKLTMELAGIFGWDVDFALDIRKGDTFNVVYEERYLDGKKLANGKILAATFVNQGKGYTAIHYTDSKGNSSYYSPDGRSMRKAFLRTPVDFTRISSRFNLNRLHPIFKTKRPHRGVDYAAPTGTPIKAAGDGRIKFTGWQNGYGNVVFIEHPNNTVTVYAHQSRLNKRLKRGSRVNQGDIIGYVGSTGWATGPHLHYEFRVNGVHRNPVTVKLPDAKPVSKSEMARFKQHTADILAQLERHQGTMLAAQ